MTRLHQAVSTRIRRGFSLIEILIAMAILSIAIISIAQLFLLSIRKNAVAAEGTRLASAAQDKLQELMRIDYDTLTAGSFFGTVTYDTGRVRQRYDIAWVIEDDTPEAEVQRITVTVTGVETTPGKGYLGKQQEVVISVIRTDDLSEVDAQGGAVP